MFEKTYPDGVRVVIQSKNIINVYVSTHAGMVGSFDTDIIDTSENGLNECADFIHDNWVKEHTAP